MGSLIQAIEGFVGADGAQFVHDAVKASIKSLDTRAAKVGAKTARGTRNALRWEIEHGATVAKSLDLDAPKGFPTGA